MEVEQTRYSILVVDDEKSNLALLNRILYPDYSVRIAKSGEEALRLVAEEKPDLILLDVIMPGLSGFDVMEKLKNDPEYRGIPVIFITALDSEADGEKGFALGAVDYIVKPFKNEIVRARVRTHMEIVAQMRAGERLGLTDPLTEIPNRRSFESRLDMEWRRSIRDKKPLSFLMIDIDKFKAYNDTYGHPQGDILLRAAALIFMRKVKRPADHPARVGGEEFAIILPDTNLEGAMQLAEMIRAEVEALRVPVQESGGMTQVTVSIGVSTIIPTLEDYMDEFVARADRNLYKAKTRGRNCVVSDD